MILEVSAAILIIIAILLGAILLRPRFPAYVRCWFCGHKTSVLYEFRNCWDCLECEQYNGFDKDGNYNKPIPAHYDERLNQPIDSRNEEFLGGRDHFCHRCSQNQLLKIQQLAKFTHFNETNYDYEMEAFKAHLEKVYKLCRDCEICVQQELELQNEAISRRLSHIDESQRSFISSRLSHIDESQKNFMQQEIYFLNNEQTILHSSYTDRSINKCIVGSILLHATSLTCSVLLAIKQVDLDGKTSWHKEMLFLHPLLLWLDKSSHMLTGLGIITGIMAKLLLGKYRLHPIDAVSCPVWLFVMLSEIGFIPFEHTGSVYKTAGLVINCLTCLICLGKNRRRRNQSNLNVTRQQMDNSFSDTASSISPFSSISQVTTRSQGESSRSLAGKVEQQSLSGTNPYLKQPENDLKKFDLGEGQSGLKVKKGQGDTSINDSGVSTGSGQETVDETVSELSTFSLGEPTMKRTNSGMFSSVSQSNFASSNQSVVEGLRSRKLDQNRPLIAPAAFKHSSTLDNHRFSPILKPNSSFGLFSQPVSDSRPVSFVDTPTPPRRSAFTPTPLYSSQRHSFTPERPSSPVITSFGASPFPNVPLQSGRLSQCSTTSSSNNFTVARQQDSVTKQRELVARHWEPVAKERRSVARQQLFTPISRQKVDLHEDWDSDIDDVSEFTSITNRCPVDSTTGSKTPETNEVPFWWHPGFIGFILGGSMVANILLGAAWLINHPAPS